MEQISSSNVYMKLGFSPRHIIVTYDEGAIFKVDAKYIDEVSYVEVYTNEKTFIWKTDKIYFTGYVMYGIPVSKDGRFVFAQQDMNGLLALDAKDGHVVWKTASKAEYSHVLVRDTHLCCSKSRNEIQLIDIETGEVTKSHKTPFDNRFEVITDDYIVNHTKGKTWEVISSDTLEVVQEIPDSIFLKNRRSLELSYKNKI